MIDKNFLLAHFWANANHIVSANGISMDLYADEVVVLSVTLRNVEDCPYTIQLRGEFSLDAFVAETDTQLVDDLSEINLDLMFALLIGGKAFYQILKE